MLSTSDSHYDATHDAPEEGEEEPSYEEDLSWDAEGYAAQDRASR